MSYLWIALIGLSWGAPDPPPETPAESESASESTVASPLEPGAPEDAQPAITNTTSPTQQTDLEIPIPALLDQAKQLYFTGQHSNAIDTLQDLLQQIDDQPHDQKVWAMALIYLGEIQYMLGNEEAARAAFRVLLEQDPQHALSVYHHPIDVIGVFEIVRREVEQSLPVPTPPPPPPRMPWWGYAGFGAGQFGQNKPARGALYLTLQVGFAAASLATWFWLDGLNNYDTAPEDWVSDTDLRGQQVAQFRYGVQWTTTFAFYTTWTVSVIDSGLSWRRTHRRQPVYGGLGPTPRGGAQVVVFAEF